MKLLDRYGMVVASLFLLIFIPLYPKLPLFEAIPGYLVRVRIEDVLVALVGCWWLIQSYRGKISWRSPLLGTVALYAVVGLISVISGVLLLETIPLETLHIGKSMLHYLRYLEYFSLFFFMFSSVTSSKHVQLALGLLALTVVVATIYGAGQSYWDWPVYSTMNREFSKGEALSLGEHARVPSTFGGHYDLAAFLVIVLPVLLGVLLNHPRWWVKVSLSIVMGLGCWLLLVSGSKTAFLALGMGLFLTYLLYCRRHAWLFKVSVAVSLLLVGSGLLIGGYVWFNPTDTRLLQALSTIKAQPVVTQISPVAQVVSKVHSLASRRLEATQQRPFDLEVEVPTTSGQAVWSENALKYGLSMGIRLDTLWPQALKGVARNLYLGSGYGTLNKTGNTSFVEADSTDNNYLRVLGETGVLGFAVFFGLIWLVVRFVSPFRYDDHWLLRAITTGFLGSTLGLLCNAVIIDVFAASKVAFTYWAVVGLVVKTIFLVRQKEAQALEKDRVVGITKAWQRWWPLLVGLLLLLAVNHQNPVFTNSRILNFSADPWATKAIVTVRCWLAEGQGNNCVVSGSPKNLTSFTYSSYLLLFYSQWNYLGTFYYANLVLALIATVLFFVIAETVLEKKKLVGLAMFLFPVALWLSQLVFIPSEVNLGLVVSMGVVVSWRQWRLTFQRRWLWLAALFCLLLLEILRAVTGPLVLVFAIPWGIVGLLKASPGWLKLLRARQLTSPASLFAATSLGLMVLLISPVPQKVSELVMEYQGRSNDDRLQAVKLANDFFGNLTSTQSAGEQRPVLVTATNPEYYSLLSTQTYDVGFLLSDVPTSAPERQLYFSDFDLTSSQTAQQFQAISNQHNLDVVALGCDERCNLYQLQSEPIRLLSASPINNQALKTEEEEEYRVRIVHHRFNIQDKDLVHNTSDFVSLLKTTNSSQLDAMIIGGDFVRDADPSHLRVFMQHFGNVVNYPVFYVPGNFDEVPTKNINPGFQLIALPHTAVFMLNLDSQGRLDRPQQLALYNSLLDVEKLPEIKNIVIVTNRLNWAAGSQGYESLVTASYQPQLTDFDQLFRDRILPKLQALTNKQVMVISGGLKPQAEAAAFYHRDLNDGVTYVVTAVNNHPSDIYLDLVINQDGVINLESLSPTNQPLKPLETYDLGYWQAALPSLQQPSPQSPPPTPLQQLWSKVIVAIMVGGVVVAGGVFVRFVQHSPSWRQWGRRLNHFWRQLI